MQKAGSLQELREAAEGVGRLVVNCRDCTKCCESGLVYVLPEEVPRLRSLGVPLVEMDGVWFIQREQGGKCPMLSDGTGRCTIYDERPMCCRLYPVDLFNRGGVVEWGVYEYCPSERRRESLIVLNNRGRMDYGAVLEAARMLEKIMGSERLFYLLKEDTVAAGRELLDAHRRDYRTIGKVSGVL